MKNTLLAGAALVVLMLNAPVAHADDLSPFCQKGNCDGTLHYINSIETHSGQAMEKVQAFIPSLTYMGPNDRLSKLHPGDAMRYYNLASVLYNDMMLMFDAADAYEAACTDASPEKLARDKAERATNLKQFKYGLDQIP